MASDGTLHYESMTDSDDDGLDSRSQRSIRNRDCGSSFIVDDDSMHDEEEEEASESDNGSEVGWKTSMEELRELRA